MVQDERGLAGTMGLYLEHTYVQRFGQVEREDIERVLAAAGASGRYDPTRLREAAKLVTRPECRGKNLGRFMLAFAYSRSFSQMAADAPHLLVVCSKRSIISHLYEPIGLRPRPIKPFPHYRVHERYRSATDPMESWLIIPDLDIPRRLDELELPGEYEVADIVQRGHDADVVTPS
jgi:GNAT superfamily N-acetyltransferase